MLVVPREQSSNRRRPRRFLYVGEVRSALFRKTAPARTCLRVHVDDDAMSFATNNGARRVGGLLDRAHARDAFELERRCDTIDRAERVSSARSRCSVCPDVRCQITVRGAAAIGRIAAACTLENISASASISSRSARFEGARRRQQPIGDVPIATSS
jgi:hypothetical protein